MNDVDGLDAGHGMEEIGISSTLKMWIMWARSSRARMEEATAVHRQLVDAVNAGANPSQLLDAEAGAVLVATTSAVFAIEGISRSLGKQVVDETTLAAWRRSRLGADRVLRQILQRSITSRATADEFADRWSRLYALRGDAVHYDESAGDLAMHPAGVRTDPVLVAYSVETAQEAWSVLIDTLQALIDDPKATAAAWVAEHREAVAEFL